MSQSSNNTDDPLFIMHIGATYAVRISVLHGSNQGLMALPVQCVALIRMQGGRGNDAQDLEVAPAELLLPLLMWGHVIVVLLL